MVMKGAIFKVSFDASGQLIIARVLCYWRTFYAIIYQGFCVMNFEPSKGVFWFLKAGARLSLGHDRQSRNAYYSNLSRNWVVA